MSIDSSNSQFYQLGGTLEVNVQRFSQFLESVLLRAIPGPIVIFVDEIDSVRSLPFDADDFLR